MKINQFIQLPYIAALVRKYHAGIHTRIVGSDRLPN